MLSYTQRRCRLCEIGECRPVQISELAELVGVENFQCDACGTLFAVRPPEAMKAGPKGDCKPADGKVESK